MKGRLLILSIVLFASACSENADNKRLFVSDVPTEQIRGNLYLPENTSLNVFYDICATDSFIYCLDFYNDTILKVYSTITFPSLIGYCIKGQGPNDLQFPFFMRNSFQSTDHTVKLVDMNAWSIKEIKLRNSTDLSRIDFDTISPLSMIPATKDYNETDSLIYGTDVDMQHGMFFIYNKNSKEMTTVDYYDDKGIADKYLSNVSPYLFENHLIVNEKEGVVCAGMININSLCFFDLSGGLKKEVIIGQKMMYPEPDSNYLDFPNAKKCFVSMAGTDDYLYCLYNAFGLSRIFKFDWKGKLISVMQTEMKLEKISVNPTDEYIYAIKMSDEGGSDIIRYALSK